jgi:hypothetical protein
MLTRQVAASKWSAATYVIRPTGRPEDHRDHREHRDEEPNARHAEANEQPGTVGLGGPRRSALAMPPMIPMISGPSAWKAPSIAELPWSEEDQFTFDERAAILEFDAGLARHEAEAKAMACCLALPTVRHVR